MNKIFTFIALIFLTAGVGLGMIALVTNHWSEKDDTRSIGLFQTCRKNGVICCTNNLDIDHRKIFKKNGEYLKFVHLIW